VYYCLGGEWWIIPLAEVSREQGIHYITRPWGCGFMPVLERESIVVAYPRSRIRRVRQLGVAAAGVCLEFKTNDNSSCCPQKIKGIQLARRLLTPLVTSSQRIRFLPSCRESSWNLVVSLRVPSGVEPNISNLLVGNAKSAGNRLWMPPAFRLANFLI
jgi:hypothetical protein